MVAPIRFNPEKDLAPTPFDEQICRLALEMKSLGLTWQPHVGCVVWDPDHWIKPESPFPGRIYFIRQLAITRTPTAELLHIYRLIIEGLHERKHEL